MLDCPHCDKSTYDGSSCSACGFTAPGVQPPAEVAKPDDLRNRCTWSYLGDRCAYIARWFPNVTEQSKHAHPSRGLCWEHYDDRGLDVSRDILARSRRDMPIDFDYSSANLLQLGLVLPEITDREILRLVATAKAELGPITATKTFGQLSAEERAANRRACKPLIELFHRRFGAYVRGLSRAPGHETEETENQGVL